MTQAVPVEEFPHHPAFVLPVEVSDVDIDELGHVSNITYLRWVQDVALALSVAVGLVVEAYRALGAVFVVRRHEIDYLRPVLRGERLELRTRIGSVMAAKCTRATEIVRRDRASHGEVDVVVARALTTWGFVDMANGRPTRIPREVRRAFGVEGRSESGPFAPGRQDVVAGSHER